MSLDLLPSVLDIFEKVKSVSGKGIELTEKRDISTYAVVKIARKDNPAHLIYYKPEESGVLNYLIAHECGHILRVYGVSPEVRKVPFTNDQIKLKALASIESEIEAISKQIPFKGLVQIVNLWYNGIIKQLTSFPSDIGIEKWIFDTFEELRPLQKQSLRKQYSEAVQGLSFQVQKMTPQKILNASNAMNCALYFALGRHFQDDFYLRAYKRSIYSRVGEELLTLKEGAKQDYGGDLDTIDKWATIFKISDWFAWRDFEDLPSNYQATFT